MLDEEARTPEREDAPAQADQRLQRKAQRAAKKAAKRDARKQKRERRREAYRALSGGRKLLRWLIGILLGVGLLVLLYCAGYQLYAAYVESSMMDRYLESLDAIAPREEILQLAPEDTEGAARVAATEAFSPDDTWVIYIYMCGSDLESMGRSQLSDTTEYYVRREKQAHSEQESENTQRRFHTFIDEMQQQGMSLPDYLFLPTDRGDDGGEGSEGETDQEGFATLNLRDIFSVELPENVSVVIETGGANNWSMVQINPNASQRFLYNSDGLTELTSAYPKNMGGAQTFAEFLAFCQTEYPADHQMLLLWNHGSGPFGFCSDEIYEGDCITLSEMTAAFAAVYGEDPATPPFELVGYDACLMASVEVAEALHGYTRYLAASEETEAGDGWPYDKWLAELAAHPEMNGAQLGRVISDTFVEACANFSINMQWLQFESVATFSVVDVDKAHAVYEAYTQLCAAALRDVAEGPWPLAAWGQAAGKSIRYAGSYYKYFNTLDLGTFMENLALYYPAEAARVTRALDDAVLYHRETSYTRGSKGLSIYFPTNVDSFYSLIYYLEYMDTVCTDPDMKALYYYKVAGCLNDELQAYADEAGYGTFPTLDTRPLEELATLTPDICEDYTAELPISNGAAALMQDMTVTIAKFEENANELRFYGDDAYLYLDEYRTLRTTFSGTWAVLDGHVLPLEIIDQTDSFIRYRVPIRYNDIENAYLIVAYDYESGVYSILGVQALQEDADTLGRNLTPVEIGSRIAILYRMEDMNDVSIHEEYSDDFKFRAESKVENEALENGTYYMVITLMDTRGDSYYPTPITFRMEDGDIADMMTDSGMTAHTSAE